METKKAQQKYSLEAVIEHLENGGDSFEAVKELRLIEVIYNSEEEKIRRMLDHFMLCCSTVGLTYAATDLYKNMKQAMRNIGGAK